MGSDWTVVVNGVIVGHTGIRRGLYWGGWGCTGTTLQFAMGSYWGILGSERGCTGEDGAVLGLYWRLQWGDTGSTLGSEGCYTGSTLGSYCRRTGIRTGLCWRGWSRAWAALEAAMGS